MTAIHIIKNDPGLPAITPVQSGSNIYSSGYWVIAEAKAKSLIGGKIFFHYRQTEPSFFGGIITDAEKVTEGEREGRVVFTFKADQNCKNVKTSRDGWAQEMKIVG